jgi:hypothetical protein
MSTRAGYPGFFKASSTTLYQQIMDFAPFVEGDLPQRFIDCPDPRRRKMISAGYPTDSYSKTHLAQSLGVRTRRATASIISKPLKAMKPRPANANSTPP